ncbi:MAG: sugar phosphate isomerase/epimerase [Planctomycetes bacterium]|nr:sugar phosphate isomerase/epimerase [Planctomycetota bacterium]
MNVNQVALQIFTIREHLQSADDFAKAMQKIRDIGYEAVETCHLDCANANEIKKVLDDVGLKCCGNHFSSGTVIENTQQVIDDLNSLDCEYAIISSSIEWVETPTTELVLDLAKKFDAAGKVLRGAGKNLIYHNHSDEFKKLDGKLALDIILENTDAANVGFEIDTYWIQHGGGDPAKWCKKLNGRLPLLHMKDYGIVNHRVITFMEIGYGNLNFREIIAEAENSGCKWFIVEQDVCSGDSLESVKKSFDYIKQNLCE